MRKCPYCTQALEQWGAHTACRDCNIIWNDKGEVRVPEWRNNAWYHRGYIEPPEGCLMVKSEIEAV
jgi:hypothetical protein